jgi:hypothetical protein
VVIGRDVHDATGLGKESLYRSMKMIVPTMGPNNTYFKHLKRNFLTFLSLKASCLIPQLAIRESGVQLDEASQNCAYALSLHVAIENKRVDHAVKCVCVARRDCVMVAWDIMCERLDGGSFASSLSMMDNLMLGSAPASHLHKAYTSCVQLRRVQRDM